MPQTDAIATPPGVFLVRGDFQPGMLFFTEGRGLWRVETKSDKMTFRTDQDTRMVDRVVAAAYAEQHPDQAILIPADGWVEAFEQAKLHDIPFLLPAPPADRYTITQR